MLICLSGMRMRTVNSRLNMLRSEFVILGTVRCCGVERHVRFLYPPELDIYGGKSHTTLLKSQHLIQYLTTGKYLPQTSQPSRDLAFSRFCPGVQGFATFVQGFSPIKDQGPIYTFPLCGKIEHTTDAMIILWSKQLHALDHQICYRC